MPTPQGFRSFATNAGIRDETLDFVAVVSDAPCTSAAVFTQSRFAGPSVIVSREHAGVGGNRAMITVSKNANVATGEVGLRDARELAALVANAAGCDSREVIVATTGVIGRPLPMDKVRVAAEGLGAGLAPADFDRVAQAMMTTDTVPKLESESAGSATVLGVAKGVGMISPNMATMLAFVFTDAAIEQPVLDAMFRRVVNRTFNCVSVDSDTSTSDTAAIFANGVAGPCDVAEFEAALLDVCTRLAKDIARDGEGATKLIEVTVERARDEAQAKKVARAIVDSPLVKTAVAGGDPNWGRIAMAVGKCSDETDIEQDRVEILIGGMPVYPPSGEVDLDAISTHFAQPDVTIGVRLNTGATAVTMWGCDLTAEYVAINAEYST